VEQTNGPRSPRGIPISGRLVVPESAAFDPVRRALAAIDAVHGDGDLPFLPVVRTRATTEVGVYEWSDRSGEPLRLRISTHSEHPELTVVHEIGHFLDHQALGRPGTFASESDALHSVIATIDSTDAFAQLRALRTRRRAVITERGRREIEPIRQQRVEYLLQPHELFARAYAQFITVRSQDPVLVAHLTALRLDRRVRVYHDYWTDADFAPVEHRLFQVLGRRRWMRSP
jgi:hypothetical protein